jgi:transposase
MAWRQLTHEPWAASRVQLPEPKASARGGRPRVEDRRCCEGSLWILWTGAPWREWPRRYGSPSTCWRRLKPWEETGVVLQRWRAFLAQLKDQQKLGWAEGVVDGRFLPATKGGPKSARRNVARGQRGWVWSMVRGRRWEHTWTRPPRRKSPAARTPSRRSPSGGLGTPAGRATARSGGSRLGATTAIPCVPGWPVGVWSRSSPRGGTTNTRPLRRPGNCGGSDGGGLLNGPLPGWGPSGASSSAMSG